MHSRTRAARWRAAIVLALIGALIPATITAAAVGPAKQAPFGTTSGAPGGVLSGGPMHGIVLADWNSSSMPAIADFQRLKTMGINTVSVYIYVAMASPTASEVTTMSSTMTDSQLTQLTEAAHQWGMAVQWAPVIAVRNASGHFWRGRIAPASMSGWWRSYNALISHYVLLAAADSVDMFSIGSELDSLQNRSYNWTQLARWTKRHFYGITTYMSTGIGIYKIDWWSALDVISVSPYYSLSGIWQQDPPIGDLVWVWKHAYLPALARVSARFHRQIVFAEIGYSSVVGSTANPSWANTRDEPASQQAQARAYTALYNATQDVPWLRGIIWWHWDVPDIAVTDKGFSPRDKQAECVIANHWASTSLGVNLVQKVPDLCVAQHAA